MATGERLAVQEALHPIGKKLYITCVPGNLFVLIRSASTVEVLRSVKLREELRGKGSQLVGSEPVMQMAVCRLVINRKNNARSSLARLVHVSL